MSTPIHGSKAGFKLGTSATPTTVVDYSTYFHVVQFPQTRDTAETTTFGSLAKSFIPGLRDTTMTADAYYSTTLDSAMSDIFYNNAVVTFNYAPAGVGVVGTPLYTGTCFCTHFESDSDVGGVGKVSVHFQITGTPTRTIQ
jgi:hypothetical protein